jgi:forkhead box protein K
MWSLQSSVRHNLSSSRAFLKLERCGGDRGKGFFWTLDEKHSQSLEEQEAKILQAAATGSQGGKDGIARGRKKDKGLLEPALKRSVKGDFKGGPLPPPLTSSPLAFKTSSMASTTSAVPNASPNVGRGTITPGTSGVFAYPTHPSNVGTIPSGNTSSSGTQNPYAALTQNWAMHSMPTVNASSSPGSVNTTPLSPPLAATSSTSLFGPSAQLPGQAPQPSPTPTGVPDVIIPIILGPIPATHPEYSPTHPNNSAKEGYMVVHDKKLILDPAVFVGLAKEKLEELERIGTRAALPILTEHMVKVLKRRRAKERGKGRKRVTEKKDDNSGTVGGPFTTAPLEPRKAVSGAIDSDTRMDTNSTVIRNTEASAAQAKPPMHVTVPVPDPVPMEQEDIGSPIVIVDDTDDEGPSAKRRKLGNDITV